MIAVSCCRWLFAKVSLILIEESNKKQKVWANIWNDLSNEQDFCELMFQVSLVNQDII
jgi:hypothetical protein